MKKKIFFLIIIFVLLLSHSLLSKNVYVKLAFGLGSGGDVEDVLLTQIEYSDYMSMGQEQRQSLGQDIYLEFIYQLNSYISFSVGNGYISKLLRGKVSQFTPPESSAFKGDYFLEPEFAASAIPICFSAICSFPVSSVLRVNFTGGVGYYIGTFENKSKWRTNIAGFSTWEYRSWNFEGKCNTVGYLFGAGFEIDVSLNLCLTVDAFYRDVNFDNIKSSGEIGDTTLSYIKFYEGSGGISLEKLPSVDFDYRIKQTSLSGYSVRAGLKFKF
ncbi:MAG: hypothetical protein ACETWK_07700 [Candidatus Aminicenantaceae bacterium]